MTTDDLNDHAGGIPNIYSKEGLTEALDRELGESVGYLDKRYREWCIEQPDEVRKINKFLVTTSFTILKYHKYNILLIFFFFRS